MVADGLPTEGIDINKYCVDLFLPEYSEPNTITKTWIDLLMP